MKLILCNNIFYVIDDDMKRMAKDLPIGTLCFCIDEFLSGHPEVRKSTRNDNCYGCQPIIACQEYSSSIYNKPKYDSIADTKLIGVANLKGIKGLEIDYKLWESIIKDISFSLKDIEIAYLAGAKGEQGNGFLKDHLNFQIAMKNIWECTIKDIGFPFINSITPFKIGKINH